jgi:hypothetical protein
MVSFILNRHRACSGLHIALHDASSTAVSYTFLATKVVKRFMITNVHGKTCSTSDMRVGSGEEFSLSMPFMMKYLK